MKRFVEIETPLEKDVLLFHRMQANEGLGQLFEYKLDLLSSDVSVNLDDVLGKSVTVNLEVSDDEVRHFNGYVSRISQGGMHGRYYAYRAIVRPWLWFLTRTTNCRIFQEKSVPDILKEIFALHSAVADVKFELTETYTPWNYCVQYRESDFNFVSRLMETEGIYYYFRHTEGRHTLVVADSYSAHSVANGGEIPFIDPQKQVRFERNNVSEWETGHELQPGKCALTDYDFEKPSVDLHVKSHFKRDNAMSEYELYDYPGDYNERGDGDLYARTRIEEVQAKFERVHGTTNARALATGYLFTLTEHPREDQNTEYLVVSAEYEIKSNEYEAMDATGAEYVCRFSALNSKQPFRSERLTPKPIVQGPQTAIVVGPSGETIYTDKFGRVKVHFHWDRYDKRDDKSSCWIRVSQNWGGKGWGGMFIPHVGQEVIVQFLEGDPDSPLITGRVYNAENMPPVALPGGKTQSIIQDHGGNKINMEGEAGAQRIVIHSPTADSYFTIGAARNPPAGISAWTNFHWNGFAGGNYDWEVKGNSTLQVAGCYIQHVVGFQEETCLGWKTEHVILVHTNLDLGGRADIATPYMMEYAKGWKLERSPKIFEMASSVKNEIDERILEKIGDAVRKIDKEVKRINTEMETISGQLTQKIGSMKREITGTLTERLGPVERKIASLQDNITGSLKVGAANVTLDSKGSITLQSKGSTYLKNTTAWMDGNVNIKKDLTIQGNTLGFGSGTFIAKK